MKVKDGRAIAYDNEVRLLLALHRFGSSHEHTIAGQPEHFTRRAALEQLYVSGQFT